MGALLTTAFTSNSAIVYTDIVDETLQSQGTLDIDFNGDGTPEFTLEDGGFGGAVEPACFFNADAGFVMQGDLQNGGWDEIEGLTAGTNIDGTSNFANNGGDGYIDPMWNPGTFPTGNDTYIGATFKLGANVHFGWIRVNWNPNGTLIVKDFAYNDAANGAISSGDEGTSTASIETETIDVDFTISGSQIQIYSNEEITTIDLYNLQGQLITSTKNSNHLSLDDDIKGLILVRVTLSNGQETAYKFVR